jgi:hypothetical protein
MRTVTPDELHRQLDVIAVHRLSPTEPDPSPAPRKRLIPVAAVAALATVVVGTVLVGHLVRPGGDSNAPASHREQHVAQQKHNRVPIAGVAARDNFAVACGCEVRRAPANPSPRVGADAANARVPGGTGAALARVEVVKAKQVQWRLAWLVTSDTPANPGSTSSGPAAPSLGQDNSTGYAIDAMTGHILRTVTL